MLEAARSVIQVRDRSLQGPEDEGAEGDATKNEAEPEIEQHAASAEFDENAAPKEIEPNDEMTAAGYDEAVERGVPYQAEETIRAEDSADPVALTEADPMSVDELILQEPGRDLRPDVVTPSPDMNLAIDSAALERAVMEAASPEEQSFDPSSDEVAATDESSKDEKR